MAQISLRTIPDELHWQIRLYQLELEKQGRKLTLEAVYIELVEKGLKTIKPDQK
jgi:hypothetical protein